MCGFWAECTGVKRKLVDLPNDWYKEHRVQKAEGRTCPESSGWAVMSLTRHTKKLELHLGAFSSVSKMTKFVL